MSNQRGDGSAQRAGTSASWEQALEDALVTGRWVYILISLPLLSASTFLTEFFKGLAREPIGLEEAIKFGQVFWDTFPLALAVCILVVGYSLRVESLNNPLVWALIFAVPLALSCYLGAGSVRENFDAFRVHGGGWSGFIESTLRFYWTIYGPWQFLSSVVVGWFVGRSVIVRLLLGPQVPG